MLWLLLSDEVEWGTEKGSNLPKVTQPGSGRTSSQLYSCLMPTAGLDPAPCAAYSLAWPWALIMNCLGALDDSFPTPCILSPNWTLSFLRSRNPLFTAWDWEGTKQVLNASSFFQGYKIILDHVRICKFLSTSTREDSCLLGQFCASLCRSWVMGKGGNTIGRWCRGWRDQRERGFAEYTKDFGVVVGVGKDAERDGVLEFSGEK